MQIILCIYFYPKFRYINPHSSMNMHDWLTESIWMWIRIWIWMSKQINKGTDEKRISEYQDSNNL